MTSRFDGPRSLMGNSPVAIPQTDAPAVDSTPLSSVADFPDLSDLDRGLYPMDDAAVRSSRHRLGIRPDDARPAAHVRRHPAAAVQIDNDDASERHISGWAAVAVVVLGLFLGGTAAMAVFRDDVSHILASWGAAPASSHSLRLQ